MKLNYILIVFYAYLHIIYATPITKFVDGLVNGQEADRGQFPWQVSLHITLKNNETMSCSGVILSEYWILTAAQCVINMNYTVIGVGSLNWDNPQHQVVSNIAHIHPDFRSIPYSHDIALINLKNNTKLNFTEHVHEILMPGGDQVNLSFEGVKAISSGWGSTKKVSADFEAELQNGETNNNSNNTEIRLNWRVMSVISNTECKSIYGSTITDTIMCARSINNGRNLCDSDIGGPISILEPEGWKIIGVASYSQSCESIQPAIYTRITSYMDWISLVTGIEIKFF